MPGLEFDAPVKPYYVRSFSVELHNSFPAVPSIAQDSDNPYLDASGNPTKNEFTIHTAQVPAPTEDDPDAMQTIEVGRTRNKPNMVQGVRTLADGTEVPKMVYGSAQVRIHICDAKGKVFHTISRDQSALSDDTVMGLVALSGQQMASWLGELGEDVAGLWAG